MPCRSDYMERSSGEHYAKRTAENLVYAKRAMGEKVHPRSKLAEQANDYYGHGPDRAPELCALIKTMTAEQLERIVYDGRNPKARQLADWWDKHQKADRRREREEAAKRKQERLRAEARAKLTPEERAALGVDD